MHIKIVLEREFSTDEDIEAEMNELYQRGWRFVSSSWTQDPEKPE